MEDELKKLISYANDPRLATFDEVRETNAVLRNILSKISGINLNDIEPVNGEDGVDGEKGDQGEKGDKGEPGKDGKDGKNGRDGRDGRDGLDGKDGVDGLNGRDGKDGSPDTGEQIIGKINAVGKDGPKIDIEKIKGLIEELEKIGTAAFSNRDITFPTGGSTRITAGTNVTVTSDGNGGYIISSTGSGGLSLLAATGTVDGSNTSFTFATEPSIIVVDQGRMMQKVSSDGTVNWTGTTSVSLAVAPQNDIYGL